MGACYPRIIFFFFNSEIVVLEAFLRPTEEAVDDCEGKENSLVLQKLGKHVNLQHNIVNSVGNNW